MLVGLTAISDRRLESQPRRLGRMRYQAVRQSSQAQRTTRRRAQSDEERARVLYTIPITRDFRHVTY